MRVHVHASEDIMDDDSRELNDYPNPAYPSQNGDEVQSARKMKPGSKWILVKSKLPEIEQDSVADVSGSVSGIRRAKTHESRNSVRNVFLAGMDKKVSGILFVCVTVRICRSFTSAHILDFGSQLSTGTVTIGAIQPRKCKTMLVNDHTRPYQTMYKYKTMHNYKTI